jgi:arylsulfatase A-like enzyme
LDGLPEPLKGLRQHNNEVDHDSVVLDLEPSREQRHRQRAHYLANVSMIDEKVGEVLTTLEKQGLSGKWDCYIHFGSWGLSD